MRAPLRSPISYHRRLVLTLLAALVTLPFLANAHAQSPTFGVAVVPFTGGWPHGMLTVSVPFYTYESNEGPVVFAGRLDVSAPVNLSALPRIGLSGTGTFTSHDMFQPFFGVGAALGWAGPADAQYVYVTPTLLAGLRVPLPGVWAVRLDAIAGPLAGVFSLGLGVDIALR